MQGMSHTLHLQCLQANGQLQRQPKRRWARKCCVLQCLEWLKRLECLVLVLIFYLKEEVRK